MRHVTRKHVYGVSNQVQHKPGCTVTGDGQRLEISDLGRRGIVLCCEKGADQLRGVVTAQLICTLVFTYAKSKVFHDMAHISKNKDTDQLVQSADKCLNYLQPR